MKALVISVGSQNYLLDIDSVERITRFGEMLSLKGSPGFLKGITKFRNTLIPIIDLPRCLGVSEPPCPTIHSCFVILKGARGLVGLYVDFARDIIEIDPSAIKKSPENGKEGETKGRQRKVDADGQSYFYFGLEDLLDDVEWEQTDLCFQSLIKDD